MPIKNDPVDNVSKPNNTEIVSWDEKYATGIELIDSQHKELISLTNKLFQACLEGNDAVTVAFKEAMSHMVEYVRLHFAAEEKFQQHINYPKYPEHKKQHEDMVKLILETVKDYSEGRKFVPNNFVRSLRDWILSHIAVYDKDYATYAADQKNKGLISDNDLEIS